MQANTSHFLNLDNNKDAPTKLFFGEQLGIYDNINQTFPDIDAYAKLMKSLDWDEQEQRMPTLKEELRTADPTYREMFINTVAWQWETDTQASRMLLPVLSNFISYDGLSRLYAQIQANEHTHGATYSEITKVGFADPVQARMEIAGRQAAFERLRLVSGVFDEMYEMSMAYGAGKIKYSMDVAIGLLKYLIAVNVMESVQFAPSFSVSAFMNLNNVFPTATLNIQKIAQDELRVHVPAGMAVIDHYLNTDEGMTAFLKSRDWIVDFIRKAVQSEMTWNNEVLFKDVKTIQGEKISHSCVKADRYVLMRAQILTKFLKVDAGLEQIEDHPIPWIENWLDISKRQSSPQEKRSMDYLLLNATRVLPFGAMKFDLGAMQRKYA